MSDSERMLVSSLFIFDEVVSIICDSFKFEILGVWNSVENMILSFALVAKAVIAATAYKTTSE